MRSIILSGLPTVAGPVDDRERRASVCQQRFYVRPRESGALLEGLYSEPGHPARGQLHDTRGASITGPELPEEGLPRAAHEVRGESRLQPLQQDVREPLQGALCQSK